MTPLHIIFYLFSGIAVISALMVVIARNPVHSVLFLVLTFFAMASVWILLQAEFLALILILVYVGAVMTLFLFVVMMLNINTDPLREGFVRYLPFAIAIVVMIMALIYVAIGSLGLVPFPTPAALPASASNTAKLGAVLYTQYAYPFEIAGVLLLTAIVASISLAYRRPTARKNQNPDRQINIKRSDRVRLVK